MIKKIFSLSAISIFLLLCNCKDATAVDTDTNLEQLLTAIQLPTSGDHALPRLFSQDSVLYFSWVETLNSTAYLHYSRYADSQWSAPETIVSGSDWFVNWADFPAIAAQGDQILTSFLVKSADGTYTYDVKLNLKGPDSLQQQRWMKNLPLHNDGTQSEHGFVSMQPYVGGSFMVTWLDGRETAGKAHGEGAMTLRGALVFPDGSVQYDTLLDDRVCDCCNTATVIGTADEIFVAYRDRSEEEIRDISLVKWQMEGGWSQPKTIGNDHWEIAGCPVNGPAMDIWGHNLAVTWFTAAEEEGMVKIAFSEDNGASFGEAFRVDAGNATGRVDVVLLDTYLAAVLWMEPHGDEEKLQLVQIDSNGHKSKPITIATTSAERASGFPQLERIGDTLYVAWTEVGETDSAIKMVSLPSTKLQSYP